MQQNATNATLPRLVVTNGFYPSPRKTSSSGAPELRASLAWTMRRPIAHPTPFHSIPPRSPRPRIAHKVSLSLGPTRASSHTLATVQQSISSPRQLPASLFTLRFFTSLLDSVAFPLPGGGEPAPKAHSPARRAFHHPLHPIPRYSLFLPCSVLDPNLYLYDFPRCHLVRLFLCSCPAPAHT
jgi:hypothetical protein